MVDPPKHKWPKESEHMFGSWMSKTGLPKATEYRKCIHPNCKYVETRATPRGN